MRSKDYIPLLILTAIIIVAGCSPGNDAAIPLPRGYFRIQLPDSSLQTITTPWQMEMLVNSDAKVTYPDVANPSGVDSNWINIHYPTLNATVYCTYYQTLGREKLLGVLKNRAERVMLNVREGTMPQMVLFQDTSNYVSHNVFFSGYHNVIPFQFISTDSATFVFSGAAYFHGYLNPDSISPAIDIIESDLLSMLQSIKFHGNNN